MTKTAPCEGCGRTLDQPSQYPVAQRRFCDEECRTWATKREEPKEGASPSFPERRGFINFNHVTGEWE